MSDIPKRGRPRTTLDYLPFDWREIVRSMAQEGRGTLEISAALGITRNRWRTLHDDYEEFREAMEEAKTLQEAWWMQHGQRMAMGMAEGSAAVWIFNMKNRFGWRDKQEITGADGGAVNHVARVEFVDK